MTLNMTSRMPINLDSSRNRIPSTSIRTGLFLLLCTVFANCFSSHAQADSSLDSINRKTDSALQKNDYNEAIAVAKLGLKKFPHDADLLCKASLVAASLDNETEAISYRERALKEPLLTVENYIRLNSVCRELEDFQRAVDITRVASSRFPDNEKMLVCLAENLRSVGKLKESRSLFQRFLRNNRENLGARLNDMDCSRDLADWTAVVESGEQMEKAIALNKTALQSIIYARCSAAKGNAHMHLKEFQQARNCYEKAMRIMPMDRPTLNAHMKACKQLEDIKTVKRDEAKLAEFDKGL